MEISQINTSVTLTNTCNKTTKIYKYNQANQGYDIYDAAGHEARLFSAEGVALTFLAHDKIKGRVLLHNRHENNNIKN